MSDVVEADLMVAVTYVEPDGAVVTVRLAPGSSLMQGALANGVRGIDGDCGGACACATCHVVVDPSWVERVGGPGDFEAQMLEFTDAVAEGSRLACQIKAHASLDGVVVRVAGAH